MPIKIADGLQCGYEVRVAAEQDADVVRALADKAHKIHGECDVDTLFLRRLSRPCFRVAELSADNDTRRSRAQRSACRSLALAAAGW